MQFIAFAMTSLFARLRSSERGQDLLEYALLGGLIAAALVALAATGILINGAGTGGFLVDMATNLGECIDFNKSTTCGPL